MPQSRREILKLATISGTGLATVGIAGGNAANDRAPCHREFSCDEGTYVKFELTENDYGACVFAEETDTGVYEDSLTVTETKDGAPCEPVEVTWDSARYVANQVMAFGGGDCETVTAPGGSYSVEGGVESGGATGAAISNLQFCVEPADGLGCPPGTRPLARYEATDDGFEFASGADVVDFSGVETGGDGVKRFDFSSTDGVDPDSSSAVLTTVTVEYGPNVETWEVDPDVAVDKRSGTVDLTGADHAVDTVQFCQASYVQADFVEGGVLDAFCNEDGVNPDNYGDRKVSSVTWSSYSGRLGGVQGQFDGDWTFDEAAGGVEVSYDPGADVSAGRVSLAVYRISDPVFKNGGSIDYGRTQCRQYLVDSDTDTNFDGTLRADLPPVEP
jgi:hypothetical protein